MVNTLTKQGLTLFALSVRCSSALGSSLTPLSSLCKLSLMVKKRRSKLREQLWKTFRGEFESCNYQQLWRLTFLQLGQVMHQRRGPCWRIYHHEWNPCGTYQAEGTGDQDPKRRHGCDQGFAWYWAPDEFHLLRACSWCQA
jgi:hypothetical protein